jgi:hypothetical protein
MPLRSQRVAAQAAEAFAVIVNAAVPDGALSRSDLQNVFLRRQLTWSNGVHVIPINYEAGTPLRVSFDRSVLGLEPTQAARYWIDARIRGGTEAPRTAPSALLVARVVPKLRGSVGYVLASQVPAGVRVVARVEHGQVRSP